MGCRRRGRGVSGARRTAADRTRTAAGPADAALRHRLLTVFERLLAAYGPRGWWPGAASPFEVIVGAILTQNTAWANVERALARLRAAGALSVAAVRSLPEPELGDLVRPSGTYRAKARGLKAFVAMLDARHGGDLNRLLALPAAELRRQLLATWGIGPETADDIVLYAAGQPSFVVDAYTVRICRRLGITPVSAAPAGGPARRPGYEDWRALFMAALPHDAALFNEFHALIVAHGQSVCRPAPRCEACPLGDLCLRAGVGGA
jgi:endonuclease-3 related protein